MSEYFTSGSTPLKRKTARIEPDDHDNINKLTSARVKTPTPASGGTQSSKRCRLADTVNALMKNELQDTLYCCSQLIPDLLRRHYAPMVDNHEQLLQSLRPSIHHFLRSLANDDASSIKSHRNQTSYTCAPPSFSDTAFPYWFCQFANSIPNLPPLGITVSELPPLDQQQTKWFCVKDQALGGNWNGKLRPDFVLSASANIPQNWRSILVVGEHQSGRHNLETTVTKLGCYAEQVFIAQPFRQSVLGIITMNKAPPSLSIWRFDRSGALGSPLLNYNSSKADLEVVVACLSALCACSPSLMGFYSSPNLSWDPKIDAYPFDVHSKVSISFDADNNIDSGGSSNLACTTILLQKALCRPATGILTRGTHVWQGTVTIGPPSLFGRIVALKFSWRNINRVPEATMYQLACDRGVLGLPELLVHGAFGTIDLGVRGGLVASSLLSLNVTVENSSSNNHTSPDSETLYKNFMASHDRQLSCLVFGTTGTPVRDPSNSPLEVALGLLSALMGHASLFFNGNILHRDISPNNILSCHEPLLLSRGDHPKEGVGNHCNLFEPCTQLQGCLIDLDYAVDLRTQGLSRAVDRTGTYPFIAINLLRQKEPHRYRHDLESLFYVMLWVAIYPRPAQPSTPDGRRPKTTECAPWDPLDPLGRWITGSEEDVADQKACRIVSDEDVFNTLLSLLRPGFGRFKPALRFLRLTLWEKPDTGECSVRWERNVASDATSSTTNSTDGRAPTNPASSTRQARQKTKPRINLLPGEIKVGVDDWTGFLQFKRILDKLVSKLESCTGQLDGADEEDWDEEDEIEEENRI